MQRCRDGSHFTVKTNTTRVKMETCSPYFLREPPGKILVEYGSVFSIECHIEGYPIPDIQWFKDSEPLNGHHAPVLKVSILRFRIIYFCDSVHSILRLKLLLFRLLVGTRV